MIRDKRWYFAIGFIFLGLIVTPILRSEETLQPVSPTDPLKIRQRFNQLKHSTQNIYKMSMKTGVVYKLQTAIGFISTIDLPETAMKVFVGDQDLFKVEVVENQVFIKPITDDREARTNLVIVTNQGRLAFDVTVGEASSADYVLDFRLPQDETAQVDNAFEKRLSEKVKEIEEKYQEKEKALDDKAKRLSEYKFKDAVTKDIKHINLNASGEESGIQVKLLSLSKIGEKAYLRFSVRNNSKTSFKALRVIAGLITKDKKFLRASEEGVVEFPSEFQLANEIQPGTEALGVVIFDFVPVQGTDKPLFWLLEDVPPSMATQVTGRKIKITRFGWLNK